MSKVIYDCIYPNPKCISRNKYYKYSINADIAIVHADGEDLEYPVAQFKELYRPEVGSWDVHTEVVKENKIQKK